MSHRGVVAEHASTASFLWLQRSLLARAPHVALRHLERVDARLLAHLRGLEIAGDFGWEAARLGLGNADGGTSFVLGYLAFGQERSDRVAGTLRLAFAEPCFEAGLLDALRWLDPHRVSIHLETLRAHENPGVRRLVLAARAFHRLVDEQEVASALGTQDVSVRKVAMEAAGALRMRGLTGQIEAMCHAPEPELAMTAALSLAMLDRPRPLMQGFDSLMTHPSLSADGVRIIEIAFRFCSHDWAVDMIRRLAADGASTRMALLAVGTWGDPATMPWLLRQVEGPYARQAGEAYALMTGADLQLLDLHRDPPESSPEPDDPADTELPWPDAEALHDHWQRINKVYQPGRRYLAGTPADAVVASRLLRSGYQRQRRAAALELSARDPQATLFPVEARADHQSEWLGS